MSMTLPPLALAYHGVADVPLRQDPHKFFVRPCDLESQIERLRDWGYQLVTFGELAHRAGSGAANGAAALTFDDGFVDSVETLLPLLERVGAPATVFVVSGWLGRPHPDASGTRILTSEEVNELHMRGVEIGAHTVTHADLTELDYDAALEELSASKIALAKIIGAEIEVAAYPYGHAGSSTRSACRDAGFVAACLTEGHGSWNDRYALPRQVMGNRASLLGLRLKRDGRYEPLMRFKPVRGVRRLSRRIHELAPR
jgi:peptidoglycan/xylan/chitin deacetylase (PgdA/CDA1 family)